MSYAESGRSMLSDGKGGLKVNRRPPVVDSKAWQKKSPAERLRALNVYRKERRLRTAYNWVDMDIYLKEEHLRSELPSDHVHPWGGAIGHDNRGPPPEETEGAAAAAAKASPSQRQWN